MSNHRPRKRFGQNFLTDEYYLQQMVAAISPAAADRLVEIGPGLGALTENLLPLCQQLHAIEIDNDLAMHLNKTFAASDTFSLHHQDALQFDFSTLEAPLRVCGNLPYNISTPLIFRCLQFASVIKDMHFLLQKEVVDRIIANPGNKNYGRLSVMTQYHCQTQGLFEIPPEAFNPAPKVTSRFVRLIPHQPIAIPAKDYAVFEKLVRQAFSQRRKKLGTALRELVGAEAFEQSEVDPNLRAEQLPVEHFVALANRIVDK